MTDKTQGPPNDLGELLGRNFGNLFALSIFQTKAIMMLASAIAKDPGVAPETKLKAEQTMVGVDEMIAFLDRAMEWQNESGVNVKGFFDDK